MEVMSFPWLEILWEKALLHLWQSTLVLVPLFLIGKALPGAPARVQNAFWWLALMKLCVPFGGMKVFLDRALEPMIAGVWITAGSPMARALDPIPPLASSEGTLAPLVGGLTVLWLVGGVGLVGRWIRSAGRARSKHRDRTDGLSPVLERALGKALNGTGIPPSAIRVSTAVTMPSVVGLLRPRILVPAMIILPLPTLELRAILLHEDAHRRRYDPLRGLLVRLVITAFFFYPLLWPLLRRLRATEEMACDEAALTRGVPAPVVAAALSRALTLGLRPTAAPSLLLSGRRTLLHRRLRRLESTERMITMNRHRLALGTAVLLLAVSILIPGPIGAMADDPATTTMPTILDFTPPEYPAAAAEKAIEGRVLLLVEVDEAGQVIAAEVAQGVPECPSMEENAVAAIRQWRFQPATRDGEAVAIWVMVPIEYRLN